MLKLVLGVVAGAVTMMALVIAGEFALHAAFPFQMADPNDTAAVRAAMAAAPMGAKVGLVAVYFVAALGGSFVGARTASRRLAGGVVTGLMAALTLANFFMLPHPIWIIAGSLALILGGGWLGARLGAPA